MEWQLLQEVRNGYSGASISMNDAFGKTLSSGDSVIFTMADRLHRGKVIRVIDRTQECIVSETNGMATIVYHKERIAKLG